MQLQGSRSFVALKYLGPASFPMSRRTQNRGSASTAPVQTH